MHTGREAALIRQISNPMASTDCTLLALAGIGHRDGRAFGFASCNRSVGAAEGMNVLREARHPCGGGLGACTNGASVEVEGGVGVEFEYGVTNVEYTEFQRLGIKDQAVREGSNESAYPANTNILYVGAHCMLKLLALLCMALPLRRFRSRTVPGPFQEVSSPTHAVDSAPILRRYCYVLHAAHNPANRTRTDMCRPGLHIVGYRRAICWLSPQQTVLTLL